RFCKPKHAPKIFPKLPVSSKIDWTLPTRKLLGICRLTLLSSTEWAFGNYNFQRKIEKISPTHTTLMYTVACHQVLSVPLHLRPLTRLPSRKVRILIIGSPPILKPVKLSFQAPMNNTKTISGSIANTVMATQLCVVVESS